MEAAQSVVNTVDGGQYLAVELPSDVQAAYAAAVGGLFKITRPSSGDAVYLAAGSVVAIQAWVGAPL